MPQAPIALAIPSACEPTEPVLLAISGGRDSVALLHLMREAGFTNLILCHLNHGLRGMESTGDAAFVRRLAKKHELKCEIEEVDVAALAEKRRISTETAAREARHAFLLRMAEKHDVWVVLVAHHAEDQAETILANLCRGTGLAGLAGMHAVQRLDSGLHLVRPMLQVRRSEIDAYLRSKRLKFREDSSNQSLKHRRNRLRHEALPLLNDIFARDVVPQVVRLGSLAEQDDDCLQRQAFAFLTAPLAVNEDRSLSITKELLALHPAVLSRVFALWFREVMELPGIENDDIEAAMSMLAPDGAAKINLPHDKHLRRKAKKLWVE
ncbi:tRNA lysidine(34) synthetase TilS [Prosthecobacter sp.]|uniref:tRNA lysidine(34) synthetase TilS n=1 Tax=Prosthecobacter sp. TaxID=1965333 RepID=UPI001DB10364|nr:tRNA lysidine(34) synthetase TilS [Prosthecobacter sp.]MCB1276709.1 tRNA lysidine(34) synthetase TilS [Prosthecobacter sp.]